MYLSGNEEQYLAAKNPLRSAIKKEPKPSTPLYWKSKLLQTTHISSGKNFKTTLQTPQLMVTITFLSHSTLLLVSLSRHRFNHNLSPNPHPSSLSPYTRILRDLKKHKTAGPNNISPSIIHHCAAEQAEVVTEIFNHPPVSMFSAEVLQRVHHHLSSQDQDHLLPQSQTHRLDISSHEIF